MTGSSISGNGCVEYRCESDWVRVWSWIVAARGPGDLQQHADSIMKAIAELMPPEYHGVYSGPTDEDRQNFLNDLRARHLPSTAFALLSLCRLFADADPEALGELASELQLVSLKRGELLIRQGDLADCMYTIVSGRLELTALADDGGERYLGELGSGETVGETGLVDDQPRMSNVRAIRDTPAGQDQPAWI